MEATKAKGLVWFQFAGIFLLLFFFSEVNGGRSCGRLLQNIKLPPHTKIARNQCKTSHVTLICDKGYYFSKGKTTKDLSCKILRNLPNGQLPRCKGCGPPPGIKNGTVKFRATSVGSIAVYSCDVGFSLGGSIKQRKCTSSLRWSDAQSCIQCRLMKDYSECGRSYFRPSRRTKRVVGGVKTSISTWPWVVKLFIRGHFTCGGTLINQEFVLTSANCLYPNNNASPHDVKVVFQDKAPTVYTCLAFYIHPDYNSNTFVNDIALVKIPKLKRFTRYKQAICLPRKVDTIKIFQPGNSMYVVGWGSTKPVKPGEVSRQEDLSKDLKQVKLPFQADKMCADNIKIKTDQGLKYWYFNSTTQFCAGDITGRKDTCQGDTGGPAMVLQKHPISGKLRWFQAGIVSWGYGCAQHGEVGYYTKVSAFLSEWIDKIINH